jgi:hypothetical protein
MPDPVTVEAGDLTAASALTGAEVVVVKQGANSRRTTTAGIAALAAGSGYTIRGSHTPTITPNSGTTATAPTDWMWSRIGNGAGAPAAGDEVTLRGKFSASRGISGQGVIAFTLPFVASLTTSVGITSVYVLADGTALSALAGLDDANTGSVTITDIEANTLVQFEITYQTANAVDP